MAHHADRYPVGVLGHDVDRSLAVEAIDVLMRELLDHRDQLVDSFRSERLTEDPLQTGMSMASMLRSSS